MRQLQYDYIGDQESLIWSNLILANQNRLSRRASVEPIIEERYWTANIRGYVDPNRRTAYRRLLNPLGFVVYSYFQSEIEI